MYVWTWTLNSICSECINNTPIHIISLHWILSIDSLSTFRMFPVIDQLFSHCEKCEAIDQSSCNELDIWFVQTRTFRVIQLYKKLSINFVSSNRFQQIWNKAFFWKFIYIDDGPHYFQHNTELKCIGNLNIWRTRVIFSYFIYIMRRIWIACFNCNWHCDFVFPYNKSRK